jgi:O-succinylbenzoate synthase
VRVTAVELLRTELPLVRPFRTSFGTDTVREALLVRVESPGSEGWGECVAGSEPLYSSEYLDAAWMTLKRFVVPRLFGAGDVTAEAVQQLTGDLKGHRMAKAAIEMAVLDAELRTEGISFRSFFGGVPGSVAPGVSVGISETIDELLAVVAGHVAEGYLRVKLKIEPGWDLEPVRAVRDLLGPGFMLQVDANTAYGRDDASQLSRLDEFGLLLIEQPLDEEDLLGHAELAKQMATPICLDESIVSARAAIDAIELGACSIVNIKAGRVGGYLEARRIHDACLERGVPVWCGGMLETGLGRAANLALATMAGFLLPGDISATDRYFHEDVTPPFVLVGGRIAVPEGPGLGVEVDRRTLDRLTTDRETLVPGN